MVEEPEGTRVTFLSSLGWTGRGRKVPADLLDTTSHLYLHETLDPSRHVYRPRTYVNEKSDRTLEGREWEEGDERKRHDGQGRDV